MLPKIFPPKKSPDPIPQFNEDELKKKIQNEKLLRQQKNQQPEPQVNPESEKRTTIPAIAKPNSQASEISHSNTSNPKVYPFQSMTFYGKTLRKIYYQHQWYFFLEDIISLTGNIDLKIYLTKLKTNQEYQKNASRFIIELSTTIDNKSVSIECIDAKNWDWLLPILRKDNKFFPGPFPIWFNNA